MSEQLPIYDGYLRNLNKSWQDNTHASRSEGWDQGSLSSWHSDIGIPNNIQKGSGVVSFWSTEIRKPLDVWNGCEAPCPDEVEN